MCAFALSICARYRGDDASYVSCAACSCASASGLQGGRVESGGGGTGALCVEMGFMWTFPRNQDATVKLKSELIFIKF